MSERIGGHTKTVTATPTISTSAYAAGDLIGGKMTLLNAVRFGDSLRPGSGEIRSVTLTDKAKQSATIDVVFFSVDPDSTTFTDNAAFDPDDSDLVEMIGFASVDSWSDFNDNSVGVALNLTGLAFDVGQNTAIYAALVSRGTPTYASTTDLTLRVGILQD